MSDISITGTGKEVPAAGGRIQATNHSAWLEQLESAQWQQRLRYQSDGGQRQSSGSGGGDADLPAEKRAGSTLLQAGGRNDTPRQTEAMPKSGASETMQAASRFAAAQKAVFQPSAALPSFAPQPWSALADEPGIAASQQLRRLPAVSWQAWNVHMMQEADGVRLWLRDACYREGDGQKLLRALRGRFAQMGLRLAQFTLNGTQIVGPDHFD